MHRPHHIDLLEAIRSNEQNLRVFLSGDGEKKRDFPDMASFVRGLEGEQREAFYSILKKQVQLQEALVVAPEYISFLNDVHQITLDGLLGSSFVQDKIAQWQKIVPEFLDKKTRSVNPSFFTGQNNDKFTQEGREYFDKAGFAHEEELRLRQIAAQEVHKAWCALLGKCDKLAVTEVRTYDPEAVPLQEEFSHQFDVKGNTIYPYYRVGSWQSGVSELDGLFDVSVHEPEHSLQERLNGFGVHGIPKKYQQAFDYMKDAFSASQGVCPRWVILSFNDKEITDLFLQSYYSRAHEVTALYQGQMMHMAFSKMLGLPLTPSTVDWFKRRPALAKQLPESLKGMLPPVRDNNSLKGRFPLLFKKEL